MTNNKAVAEQLRIILQDPKRLEGVISMYTRLTGRTVLGITKDSTVDEVTKALTDDMMAHTKE